MLDFPLKDFEKSVLKTARIDRVREITIVYLRDGPTVEYKNITFLHLS